MNDTHSTPAPWEKLQALLNSGYRPNIAKFLDFKAHVPAADRAVVTMDVDARHHNPMGTLHGGILCDISDAAMGIAFNSGLSAGEAFTTLELKINFLKPVFQGKLTAEAEVLRRGRTVGLVLCNVYDEKRSLVAHVNSSVMVLRGEKAENRSFQELTGDTAPKSKP